MEEDKAIKFSIAMAIGIFLLFIVVFSINVTQTGSQPFREAMSIAAMIVFVSVSIACIAVLLRSVASSMGF